MREKAKNKAEFGVPYSKQEIEKMNKQEKKIMEKNRKKALGIILQDQKANSVADMAAVLAKLDFNPPVEEVVVEDEVVAEEQGVEGEEGKDAAAGSTVPEESAVKTEESTEGKAEDAAAEEEVKEPEPVVPEEIRVASDEAPIVVQWKNILDAEYAEKWPAGVVHDFLDPRDAPPVVEEPVVEEPLTEETKG